MSKSKATEVLGLRCFVGDVDDAASRVVEQAAARRGGYACLCNVHALMTAERDEHLASALRDAWTVFPDGAPLAWLQRRTHGHAKRVAGADLLCEIADAGRAAGLRHFFFGSSSDVLDSLVARLELAYPGVDIVGATAPPVADAEALGGPYLDQIRGADADIVWCGLGAPKQELWMHRYTAELGGAVVIGVGAAFDFLAGTKRRAPRWMQSTGLEWLHRLLSEPRRLGPRYVRTNSRFLLRVATAGSERRRT